MNEGDGRPRFSIGDTVIDPYGEDGVPILEWRVYPPQLADRGPVAVIRIDGDAVPKVGDIPRVLSTEPGNVNSGWAHPPHDASTFMLGVQFLRPVRAAFGLLFHVPDDRPLLDAIRATRFVAVINGPLPETLEELFQGDLLGIASETEWLGSELDRL